MINYQRYLREKKEIESEEELLSESLNNQDIEEGKAEKVMASLSPATQKRYAAARRNNAFKPVRSQTDSSGRMIPAATNEIPGFSTVADKAAMDKVKFPDEKKPEDLSGKQPSLKDRIFRAKGVGNGEAPAVDDKSKPIDSKLSDTAGRLSRDMRSDTINTRRPVSPELIRGNTVSEIISSANGDITKVPLVINAVKKALQKANLDVPNLESFLS